MTSSILKKSINPQIVVEGAGVRLLRSISPSRPNSFDPFLLFDHFAFNDPAEGVNPGFPTHPHRGIETVTYVLEGAVQHRDSLGNTGLIKSGDVQWMSAGSGILHEEMPRANSQGRIRGFQLWVNLPASLKMSAPRYQEISSDNLIILEKDNYSVKVIAGNYQGVSGPVKDISIEPNYFHFIFKGNGKIDFQTQPKHTTLIYLVEGSLIINNVTYIGPIMLDLAENELVSISAESGTSFLFISGKKIGEQIVPYGPFVMNTEDEIRETLNDLRNGTFIKD